MHVTDLMQVERELGYNYESERSDVGHYQWICPPCRRAMFGLAQAQIKLPAGAELAVVPEPVMPRYANSARGEGPLGREDRENYHP
jgi:hypothetical protein